MQVVEKIYDVKEKAQQQYYTQDRMITGEDYPPILHKV